MKWSVYEHIMHPKTLLRQVLNYAYFSGEKPPLPVHYTPGNSRLVMVTGENASGKSFFVRVMAAYCRFGADKEEAILVDMTMRTEGGLARAFVFGDEGSQSTGNISLQSVVKGITTCKGREKNHYIFYDEPEIGLSEGYQMAMGAYFARFMEELPANTKGVVIATHSKYVVQPLVAYTPHHIHCGPPATLEEWLTQTPKARSIDELLALNEDSWDTYRNLDEELRRGKEEKEERKVKAVRGRREGRRGRRP